jgi:DNA-binding TFAR19-related protein (PDSD5 family)
MASEELQRLKVVKPDFLPNAEAYISCLVKDKRSREKIIRAVESVAVE